MPPSESSIHNTPLAPSVEKAYYRKCIQLKRRLNEIEGDNDNRKIRIERLNRSILKMRLERAFLLDELRKRMTHNVDGSEGSGSEGAVTPPPDRPHRDKRRRPDSGRQAPPTDLHQYEPQQAPRVPSQNEREDALQPTQSNGSTTGPANGAEERQPVNRSAAATGEALTAGPAIVEASNERAAEHDRKLKALLEAIIIRNNIKRVPPNEKRSEEYKERYADCRRNYKNAWQNHDRFHLDNEGRTAREAGCSSSPRSYEE